MKKLFTLVFAMLLSVNVFAQCPYTTAFDFQATDCHGTQVNLFEILDGGQYVLIDFFFTTCGPCQQATPKIVESYYAFGCNMHDVYYMEISVSDGNTACQNWANNYGVEYPTIGTDGGGATICSTYGIQQYPTVILIAPDHSIVIQDLWPIGSAQAVINALTPYGIEEHDCTAPVNDPEVTIFVDQVLETEVTATFTPNEECASYYYMMATEEEFNQWTAAAGLNLAEYLHTYGFPADSEISHTFTDLIADTEYLICAVPADADGNLYEVAQEDVITIPGGSDIMPDFTGTDLEGNEIHLYSILDAGQYVLINFFLTGDSYSENVMNDMISAYHLYGCNQHDIFFMEISGNGTSDACQTWVETFGVEYPTISKENGGQAIVQNIPVALYPTIMLIRPDHTFAQRDIYPPTLEYMIQYMEYEGIQQYECDDSVDEDIAKKVSVYPNPANDFVKIEGNNLDNVQIFNILGQKVEEFEMQGNELNVNTSDYENGVYFVKVGGKTQRFVVTH